MRTVSTLRASSNDLGVDSLASARATVGLRGLQSEDLTKSAPLIGYSTSQNSPCTASPTWSSSGASPRT